jgi:hypothetical protein
MTKFSIDELLRGSDPWSITATPDVQASVQQLVADTQSAAAEKPVRRRWSKLWLVPLIGVGGLALTGGALAVDAALFPELPIAINYTTDTGVAVSCTAQIEGGSMFSSNSTAVVDYFKSRDLSGIGQQIYNHAMVLTGDAVPTAENTPESNSWVPAESNWVQDRSAFNMSLVDYLVINTQIDLGLHGDGGWLTSDCTGQMH